VPRSWPRAEQLIRARAFAKLGLLEIVEPTQLSSETLRTAIGRALRQSSRELRAQARSVGRFDGAQRAAAHLLPLALARRWLSAASLWSIVAPITTPPTPRVGYVETAVRRFGHPFSGTEISAPEPAGVPKPAPPLQPRASPGPTAGDARQRAGPRRIAPRIWR